jgi:hypothetical protein
MDIETLGIGLHVINKLLLVGTGGEIFREKHQLKLAELFG